MSALAELVFASVGNGKLRVAHLLRTADADNQYRRAICGTGIGYAGGPLTHLPDDVPLCKDCHDPRRVQIKRAAHRAVKKAVKQGHLTRQPCETCGCPPFNFHPSGVPCVRAHHDDYSEPLQVRWLCSTCHARWHKRNTPRYPEGVAA